MAFLTHNPPPTLTNGAVGAHSSPQIFQDSAGVLGRVSIGLILAVGLLARLAVLIVHQEITTLPQGGADEASFERMAWALSQDGRNHISNYLFSGSQFFPFLASFVYDLTGRVPYALGLLIVLIGTATIFLAYRCALELWGDRKTARIVAWACALFPQLVLHSALFLREIPVAFCLAAAGLFSIRFLKSNSLASLAGCSLWVVVGTLLHTGVIVTIPALVTGIILLRGRDSRGRIGDYVIKITAVFVLAGVIYGVNATGFGMSEFGGSLDEALTTFEAQEASGTFGGAAYPEWMRLSGGLSEGWKIPVRYGTFLFSPLIPYLVRNPRHLLGLLDAALYLLLFWILLRNWRRIAANQPALVLLITVMALFLVYSLGVSNFGTAIRHRAKMAPLLLVVAAAIPALKRRRQFLP